MARSIQKNFRNVVSVVGIGALLAASAPNCVGNEQSMFIRQINALTPPTCQVKGLITEAAINRGVLDVAVGNSYVLYPLVGSQLITRGDPKTNRAEPNRVFLQGAEVHLVDGSGVDRGFFSAQTSGVIDPTTSSDASYGVTAVEVIPPVKVRELASLMRCKGLKSLSITASIKVFGETLGKTAVESNIYNFPIQLCYGCLVNFPLGSSSVGGGTVDCKAKLKPEETTTITTCQRGQDYQVDCRTCQDQPTCSPCVTDAECTTFGGKCDTSIRRCDTTPTQAECNGIK